MKVKLGIVTIFLLCFGLLGCSPSVKPANLIDSGEVPAEIIAIEQEMADVVYGGPRIYDSSTDDGTRNHIVGYRLRMLGYDEIKNLTFTRSVYTMPEAPIAVPTNGAGMIERKFKDKPTDSLFYLVLNEQTYDGPLGRQVICEVKTYEKTSTGFESGEMLSGSFPTDAAGKIWTPGDSGGFVDLVLPAPALPDKPVKISK